MHTISSAKIGKLNPPTNVTELAKMRRYVADTGGGGNAGHAFSKGVPKNRNPIIRLYLLGNS
jgi:hypothetical protein